MIELATLAADRAALRERWYREGHFRRETVGEAIAATAARAPQTLVTFAGPRGTRDLTLAELHERALRLGASLEAAGLSAGDVVAIQAPATVEAAVAYQAAFLRGFVVLPIVHMFGPAELSFVLRQSGARALIVPDRHRSTVFRETVASLADVPALEHVVVIGTAWPGSLSYDELLRAEPAPAAAAVDPDDVCLVIYTSGTTAEPKGAMHSHNSFLAQMRSVPEAIPRGGGAVLGVFPTGHIAGTIGLMSSAILGERYLLLEAFDAGEAARLIERHRVTASAGTPYHLQLIMDAAEADGIDLSSLSAYMTGAASVSVPLLERAERLGIRAFRGFGMTEHPEATSSAVTESSDIRFLTDGRGRFGTELRLVDDDGADVARGAEGEIALIGPRQSLGYLDPSRDAESHLPGGWFLTGDIGRLTAEGNLVVTDRKKDMINRGGEKLSAREIEDILSRMDAVAEACVTSMPDERLGERVRAFLILKPGRSISLSEVRARFAEEGVAAQKTPERLDIVSDFPRTPAGKPKKAQLRLVPA